MNKNKKAFTLAEVLITLVIVGIIAALTLPTLIIKNQKEETAIKLKKAYSTLANAANLAISAEGPMETWELGANSDPQAAEDFADTYLIPYLSVAKNCGTQTTGECEINYKYLNDASYSTLDSSNTRLFLNDGTLIYGYVLKDGSGERFVIRIDINGKKSPNMSGRDIFAFNYWANSSVNYKGVFLPAGISYDREAIKSSSSSGCNKNAKGIFCSTLIMKDGWKIADDYPW